MKPPSDRAPDDLTRGTRGLTWGDAVERPDGLLVDRLLEAGVRVLAVHPNQETRNRAIASPGLFGGVPRQQAKRDSWPRSLPRVATRGRRLVANAIAPRLAPFSRKRSPELMTPRVSSGTASVPLTSDESHLLLRSVG